MSAPQKRKLKLDQISVRSIRSRKSNKRLNCFSRKAPSKASLTRGILRGHSKITTSDFFNGISINIEFGKDFLREMDTPICTSKIVTLPLNLSQIAPGRCVVFSPFGHTSNMSFHCDFCNTQGQTFQTNGLSKGQTVIKENDDLYSVALAFYNNAEKVVQHKAFYLSLLSHSMETVRKSFAQPGLLYGFITLKTYIHDVFPIFIEDAESGLLKMCAIFHSENLHISETCLRLLIDNLPQYQIMVDCIHQQYVLKIYPNGPEDKAVSVPEDNICKSVATLDYTDEMKQEIVNGTILVCDL